ncbi:MAG: DegV family protein [Dehalococcoidia bacterium]|nr:DegV family protein [Dehalococcoidia bacterium]MDD5494685.1 DegV family protein [Dehalococcoidia bacterium]
MTVKIVTDSSSDIPHDVARELGITVVPLYVTFGTVNYKDGVDITPDEFFQRLQNDPVHPTTSAASPGDFHDVYNKLSKDADEIISIHLSKRVSATWDAAMRGRDLMEGTNCRIEVIDSRLTTMALGLISMAAANAARAGKNMQNIIDNINNMIPRMRLYGVLDTLKYIVKGGRLGKIHPIFSSILPIKPLLVMKDGTIMPTGVVRTKSKGIDHLVDMVKSTLHIREIGISHSSADEEVKAFCEKVKSILPDIKPTVAKLGPALGVHGGPGAFLVALQQDVSETVTAGEKEHKLSVQLPSLQSIKESILQRKPHSGDSTNACVSSPLIA